MKNPLFRIGQGTRNGYGCLSIISCKEKVFNLKDDDNAFEAYLNFDPSFNKTNNVLQQKELSYKKNEVTHFQLNLKPDSFFIFGSGYGDEEVDNKPFKEDVLVYQISDETKAETIEFIEHTVIPASSIKGAISHRTCYHFNKNKKVPVFADEIEVSDHINHVGVNNSAVAYLFGVGAGNEELEASRGKIIINDLYFSEKEVNNDKILNHVAIDRFTGGAINGALFSEKVSQHKGQIILDIWVERFDSEEALKSEEALEEALKDICKGLLPLGGMTTKGHGEFIGSLTKNDINIPL